MFVDEFNNSLYVLNYEINKDKFENEKPCFLFPLKSKGRRGEDTSCFTFISNFRKVFAKLSCIKLCRN